MGRFQLKLPLFPGFTNIPFNKIFKTEDLKKIEKILYIEGISTFALHVIEKTHRF